MNVNRAREILAGGRKITVELSGVPVWIDSVDSAEKSAKVHAEHNPADSRVVSVEELEEVL